MEGDKQSVESAITHEEEKYEQHAELQRQSGDALLELATAGYGRHKVEAGCGTGWYSRYWRDRGSILTALDLTASMLDAARQQHSAQHYLLGDIDHLPLTDNSVDGVWSNLAVQWSSDLRLALQQFLRVTRAGGSVLFSTLLDGSLHEVHHAWAQLDGRTHANRFLSESQFSVATLGLPLSCQQQVITLHFPSALSAMRSLKGIGATHLHDGRGSSVVTRKQLAQLEQHWPQDAQGYRLSYHLMFGVLNK